MVIPKSALLKIGLAASVAAGFAACQQADSPAEDGPHGEPASLYLCPAPPEGRTAVTAHGTPIRPFIGTGYDVTGDYLGSSSVRPAVLDPAKMPEERIVHLRPFSAYAVRYAGADARGFMADIARTNGFAVPTERETLFAGTLAEEPRFPAAADRSTRYTFVSEESVWLDASIRFNRLTYGPERWAALYTDDFGRDLAALTAPELVEKYGTHVLMRADLGSRVRSIYRSTVADSAEELLRTALYGLTVRRQRLYGSLFGAAGSGVEEAAARNYGSTIVVEFFGGDPLRVPLPTDSANGGTMELGDWHASLDETNRALVRLTAEDLLPLDELVADPDRSGQIRDAIRERIRASRPDLVETLTLYQAVDDRGNHRYFLSYDEFLAEKSGTLRCGAPLGGLFPASSSPSGTTALYRYTDGQRDRLATVRRAEGLDGLPLQRLVGHIHDSAGKGRLPLYELRSGRGCYAYTTEETPPEGWERSATVGYLSE